VYLFKLRERRRWQGSGERDGLAVCVIIRFDLAAGRGGRLRLTCVPRTTICGSCSTVAPTVLNTSCSLFITGIRASMVERIGDDEASASRRTKSIGTTVGRLRVSRVQVTLAPLLSPLLSSPPFDRSSSLHVSRLRDGSRCFAHWIRRLTMMRRTAVIHLK